MPLRLPAPLVARLCRAPAEASRPTLTSAAASAVWIQTRNASILADLRDNKGAYQKRIRVGRGPSSGYGKTSGRGQKGQKAHGKVKPWFQGGQTPLLFQRGRLGFENIRAPVMSEVNLDKLQQWIDAGRLDASKRITPRELIKSRLVGSIKDGIKLLARGGDTLKQPVDIIVSRASGAAIEAIEKAGGQIVTRYFTKQSLKRLVEGSSVITDKPLPVGSDRVNKVLARLRAEGYPYRLPDPTSRWDMEYYRDPAHRGYLSYQVQPGHSPSLYFNIPPSRLKKKVKSETEKQLETKLWEKL